VVKTGGFFGGMEYPSIVFIQGDFFDRMESAGEAVVAHETAHQWFYGLVGNDEVREAWVDESLSDYATMAFLQQMDESRAQGYIRLRLGQSKAAETYAGQGLSAWQDLERFPNWKSYNDLVYARAGAMWWELKEAWGTERLHQVLREYVTLHQYDQASGSQIVHLLSKAAGSDATPFIDYWLSLKMEKEEAAKAWVQKGKHE
jgi:aminopeptidase N